MTIHSFTRLTGAAAALALAMAASPAFAQEPQQPTPAPRAEAQQQPAQASKVEGELMSVDAQAKTLVVKTAAGQEETIRYTDDTKVSGGQSNVAGLAKASGTRVTVSVSGSGASRVATEIMIHEKQ